MEMKLHRPERIVTAEELEALNNIMKTENLRAALEELYDFVADMPSGFDGFTSDFDAAFKELERIESDDVVEIKPSRKIFTRKHLWKKNNDGEVDEWAWECGYCNGPECEICGATFCVHCDKRNIEIHPDGKSRYDEENCKPHYICSECGRAVKEDDKYCTCGVKFD